VSDARLESALLVPVPEAEPCVRRHRFRYDSVALRGVPAHITVVFPFMPPAAITDETLGRVRQVLTRFSAFRFSLTRLQRFPEGALYLAPDPAEPFVRLTTALVERFPEYPAYGGAYADVIPHLTIAQLPEVATPDEVSDIRRSLPIPCEAREILLMVENEDHQWHMRFRFALDGRNPM
jgi:2'-5' RNA ligase